MEEDKEEQLQESIEAQQEAVKDYIEEDSSPSEIERESLYSLFWKVIKRKDSSKIANLEKYELGLLDMTVRDCQAIAVLCDFVGYTEVANWLRLRAEITLATSLSKKALLLELFVTAKKYQSKEKRMGIPEITVPQKKGFWSRFK